MIWSSSSTATAIQLDDRLKTASLGERTEVRTPNGGLIANGDKFITKTGTVARLDGDELDGLVAIA